MEFRISPMIRSNPFKGCFFVLCLILLQVTSCNNPLEKEKEQPIARAGDMYLYPSDLQSISFEKEDSAAHVKQYIETWIRESLLLQQAEKNLTDEQKKFERMVEDYRRSLITYEYESQIIRQKLDTVVSDEEIAAYYEENKSNFELKDNIIKVIYVKVRKNVPKLEKLKGWISSSDIKDKDALAGFCHQYAENFYLDDNTWLLFDDVLKEIPIKLYDKEAFLLNNRKIETQDSSFYYFVNIKGFMTRNSVSPLSFEKDNIEKTLLNKRKVELVQKMRKDLYQEGLKNKTIEIYEK